MKNKCKHENGWVCCDNISVHEGNNFDLVADFRCNNLDCKVIKTFKFDVDNFEEI